MGQQQSYSAGVPGSARWVEALKLALLTSTVAALQFVRYHLTNRDDRPQPQNRMLDEVPADIRRACVSFIDYHAMPLLVDQWRLKLVSMLLNPETGPVLRDSDPHPRQRLLASLSTMQQETMQQERRVTQRTSEPHRPAPAQIHEVPSAPPRRSDNHRSDESFGLPSTIYQPVPCRALESHAKPSAPPLPSSLRQELEAGILPSQNCHQHSHIHAAECSICMEADVEVAVDTCKHAMCLECAKAICAIPDRAPQCPFCRGPILSMSPIKP